jgi:hypothetical protein
MFRTFRYLKLKAYHRVPASNDGNPFSKNSGAMILTFREH